jgi:Protein of unknown function (DUF1592)/Protein of unknown function (DUF1588)/Protein of unknown function (DUF1585)/Protein of unknown function (DUF1587)/Protein of unknown function (DUF1595)/Planctomycete cytochrome C
VVPVRLSIMVLMICLVAGAGSSYAQQANHPRLVASHAKPGSADFESLVKPFVEENCLTCHNDKKKRGGFSLEKYETHESMVEDADKWEEVVRKLQSGEMPPEDEPQPDKAQVKAVTQWVDREITKAEKAMSVDPGRVTTRRLNRTEYNNSIRDLLAVDIRPADEFPQDDSGYGFDNIGDVLSLPPVLMERYIAAADKVVRAAIYGVEVMKPTLVRLDAGQRKIPERKEPLFEYDTTGLTLPNALHATHQFPVTGDYTFKVSLGGLRPAGSEPLEVALWIDGKIVRQDTLDPDGGASFFDDRQDFSGKTLDFKVHMTAGSHWIAGTVLRMYEGLPTKYNGPNPSKRPPPPPRVFKPRPNATPEQIERQRKFFEERQKEIVPVSEPRVSFVEVAGPYDQKAGASAESRARVFSCGHVAVDTKAHLATCPTKIVSSFARRAFRRPVTAAETKRFVDVFDMARKNGETFDESIGFALQAVLVSPDFLFRIERDRPVTAAARASNAAMGHQISQHELATRLSYFLWASLPDAELRRVATNGTLRQPAVLRAQVTRMLKDPRARVLAEEFGGQWLQFRALESLTRDRDKFPDFEDYLRISMRRETELFIENIIREDRPITDFLDAPYTFVNERLARHYGIPDVTGPEFRRVDLTNTKRGGVLTQASVLTVSSYATRTSPVLRGKWVLDNILGTPPPDPPADIPNLDEEKIGADMTGRQQLEAHRKNPTCSSCHRRMDPLGFGLENFDAIGAWRDVDGKFPIDATGRLPDGREFEGPVQLRNILKEDREAFTRTLASKLMTYALGRGLERYDRHAVKTIARKVAANNYRFSSLVMEIVSSRPFQMRRGKIEPERTVPGVTATADSGASGSRE